MYTKQQLEIIHLQDSYTIFYAILAGQILDALGADGEFVVREATRRYGADRGIKRREKHQKLGAKINMHSLFGVCSDLPPDPRFRRDLRLLNEEERNSRTLVCPMAEIWDQYNARTIGRMYCEEFHRACYREYAYGYTQVNLARTLTQDGDEYCDFHVVLRKANIPDALKAQCFSEFDSEYIPLQIENSSADAKTGFSSLCIRVFYYFYEVLLERSPLIADEIMRKGLNILAEDTDKRLTAQAFEMEEKLNEDFMNRNYPLYSNIDDDPMLPEYDRFGAKQLLKEGFYDYLLPRLFMHI